jgi:hypothetical protein
MKRLFTFVITMLLGAGLAFAQDTGGTQKGAKGKPTTKTSKAHKGGKKSKKGSSSTTTTAPK